MRVGFEVRVEIAVAGETVLVTLTRTQVHSLGLELGATVWVRVEPSAQTFALAGAGVAAGS